MGKQQEPCKSTLYKRAKINNALNLLSTQHMLSPKKAREWMLQEAMAKKANLDEVAEAILSNKTVTYPCCS